MIINVICIILLVLTAATVVNTIEIKKKQNNVSFQEAMNLIELPIVTVNVNNSRLNFVIDTGCSNSCINKSVTEKLKIPCKDLGNTHIGIEGNVAHLTTSSIGFRLKKKNYLFDFNVTNMDNAFNYIKEMNGIQLHGLLGSDFLSKYNYVIDYKDCILYKK